MSARSSERAQLRRFRRLPQEPMSKVSTSGMADIAFLLLIFFMLIVYEPDRTEVDLPDSEVRVGSEADAALVVLTVGPDDDSDVVLRFTDGQAESWLVPDLAAVEAEASALLAKFPGKVFKIKGDGKVSARFVTRVFDALSDAGASRVLMLTDPVTASTGGSS